MSPLYPSTLKPAHVLWRLMGIAWAYRVRCCVVLGLQLLVLVLTVGALGLSGAALDVVQHALRPAEPAPHFPFGVTPPPSWSAFELVVAIAIAVVLLGCLRAALSYVYTVAVADLVQGRLVPKVRAQLYEKLQQLSFRFYDRHASGSLLNRVTSDVQSLRSFVDMVLIQALVMLLALGVYGT